MTRAYRTAAAFKQALEQRLRTEFRERETFAYACEAYACVVRHTKRPAERVARAAEVPDCFGTGDARVEPGAIAEIVRNAAERRNGWKLILERCAPSKRRRRSSRTTENTEPDR